MVDIACARCNSAFFHQDTLGAHAPGTANAARAGGRNAMKKWTETAVLTALGWLLPGGGYLLTRRYVQFAAAFALICSALLAGLALQGGSIWIGSSELEGVDG